MEYKIKDIKVLKMLHMTKYVMALIQHQHRVIHLSLVNMHAQISKHLVGQIGQ